MSSTNATSDMFLKNISSATKSNATVASTSSSVSKSNKLPPNAKVVGNYLLGIFCITQAKISGKVPLARST